jgi:hypothetical protein
MNIHHVQYERGLLMKVSYAKLSLILRRFISFWEFLKIIDFLAFFIFFMFAE